METSPPLSCSCSLDSSALDRSNGMTPIAAIDEVIYVPRSNHFRYKNKDSEPSPAIYEPSNEDLGNPSNQKRADNSNPLWRPRMPSHPEQDANVPPALLRMLFYPFKQQIPAQLGALNHRASNPFFIRCAALPGKGGALKKGPPLKNKRTLSSLFELVMIARLSYAPPFAQDS
ncbi:hypothetical protein V6N13_019788 [Hibiscus sabdariffa]|uniref:Uncharacterized protein n=1 Tax=Hibiscus sabdariffa TaxID=183260 RepID=A0ABR2NS16_9ROSI